MLTAQAYLGGQFKHMHEAPISQIKVSLKLYLYIQSLRLGILQSSMLVCLLVLQWALNDISFQEQTAY